MMYGGWKDKALFTPGPLTTSRTVKQAMLRDLGSRDTEFIQVVQEIRGRLVELGDPSGVDYTAILMQGSGTFSLEAVLGSAVPPDGKLLILVNGAYGRRLIQMAGVLKIAHVALTWPEERAPEPDEVDHALAADPAITHVAVVHCETTTGIFNPVREIGHVVAQHGRRYIVDAMSSFGAVPLNLAECAVDYLVSSANKCIEGVPGFGYILARRSDLVRTAGWARSLSLDLYAQWRGLEADGQFRFTPPTHALLAFHQALLELEAEGGVAGRAERYQGNYAVLIAGMRSLGFKEFLPVDRQGYIITSFYYPAHPRFNFHTFYRRLSDKGHVIYPGKLSQAECFRIGHIGRLNEADIHALLAAIHVTLEEMDVQL